MLCPTPQPRRDQHFKQRNAAPDGRADSAPIAGAVTTINPGKILSLSFFRDEDAFHLLEQQILPEVLQKTPKGASVRIWVAAM